MSEKQSIRIRYEGQGQVAKVPGLGQFEKNKITDITDPGKVEAARKLVASNVNFKEVKTSRKGDQ